MNGFIAILMYIKVSKLLSKVYVKTCHLKISLNGFSVNHPTSAAAKKMKVLNVAEKNDAAKNIAGFLSNGNNRRVIMSRCRM